MLLTVPLLILGRLEINNAPSTYYPPDDPVAIAEKRLREVLPQDDFLVVLFHGQDLFSTPFLHDLDDLAGVLQSHDLIDRVFSLTTMERIGGQEDTIVIAPLIDPERLMQTTSVQRRQRALEDRFAPGWLISGDGNHVALVVRPVELKNSFQFVDLFETVRDRIAERGLDPRVAAYAGTVALNVAQFRSMLSDSTLFIPANFVIGLALVWWLFRDRRMLLLSAVAILSVSLSTVALHVLASRPYTLVSAISPAFMTALCTALLVHLFNALWFSAARGYRGREQIEQALGVVLRPAWYTTITTAAALASLGLSPVQPVKTFGLTTGAGMLILYFIAMVLLPPLLQPLAVPLGKRQPSIRLLDRTVVRIAGLGLRHTRKVVAGATLLTLAAFAAALHIEVETNLYHFFAQDHWLIRDTHTVEQSLTGVVPLDIVFTAPSAQGLLEPARLHAIRDFQHWLETLPEVDRSVSVADLVEELHWAFHGEAAEYRRIPDSREMIHQYLFIYNGQDLYELADTNLRVARVVLNLSIHGANAIQGLLERIENHLHQAELRGMQWHIAGLGRLFADEEDLLLDGLNRSSLIALVLIFLLLALLWRSWTAASLCMLPNVAPVILIFGLMGMFGIWLDMATAMIASVAVGIAVDDTIHIFHGFSARQAAGASPAWALVRTLRRSGRAVTATTLILCIQFLMFTTSQFQPTAKFGLLTAVGLVAAFVYDLLVLPALLMLTRNIHEKRVAHPTN